ASHLDVRQSGDGALVVQSPNPPYALRRFAVERPTSHSSEALHDALLDLRRLLVWFEAGPTGGVTYFKRPLDNAVRKGRVSGELLAYSLESGLLREKGKMYVAEPEEVGLDMFLIRRGETNE